MDYDGLTSHQKRRYRKALEALIDAGREIEDEEALYFAVEGLIEARGSKRYLILEALAQRLSRRADAIEREMRNQIRPIDHV